MVTNCLGLNRIWTDICSVYEYHEYMMENKSTGFKEVCIHENIPCRISFEMLKPARKTGGAVSEAQRIKLFCDKNIPIKSASKIVVVRDGVEYIYKNSGSPAVYSSHQEILLTKFGGWA